MITLANTGYQTAQSITLALRGRKVTRQQGEWGKGRITLAHIGYHTAWKWKKERITLFHRGRHVSRQQEEFGKGRITLAGTGYHTAESRPVQTYKSLFGHKFGLRNHLGDIKEFDLIFDLIVTWGQVIDLVFDLYIFIWFDIWFVLKNLPLNSWRKTIYFFVTCFTSQCLKYVQKSGF